MVASNLISVRRETVNTASIELAEVLERKSKLPIALLKQGDKYTQLEAGKTTANITDALVIEVSDEYLKELNKNAMKTLAAIAQGIFLNEEAKTTGKSIDDLIEDYSIDTSKKVVWVNMGIAAKPELLKLAIEKGITYVRPFIIMQISNEEMDKLVQELSNNKLTTSQTQKIGDVLKALIQEGISIEDKIKDVVSFVVTTNLLASEIISLIKKGTNFVNKIVSNDKLIYEFLLAQDAFKVNVDENYLKVKITNIDIQKVKAIAAILESPKIAVDMSGIEKVLSIPVLVKLREDGLISLKVAKLFAEKVNPEIMELLINNIIGVANLDELKIFTLRKLISVANQVFKLENHVMTVYEIDSVIKTISKHKKSKVKTLVFRVRRKIVVLEAA
ncbi:MAG: hypothetical protein U0354_19860 [Candidatus Sericytochromatia bacterium]